jgi:hypothetical protein
VRPSQGGSSCPQSQLASLDDSQLDYVKSDSDPLRIPGSTPDRAAPHDFVARHFKNIPLRD